MVLNSLSTEELLTLQKKFPFINDFMNYEKKLNQTDQELSFINTIFKICLTIAVIVTLFMFGVSTYLTIIKRKGEIAISYILGISKEKLVFKFFIELFSVFCLGFLGSIVFAYGLWELTMSSYLAKMGSFNFFTIPVLPLLIPASSLLVGVLITIITVGSIEPVSIITKNAETNIL